MLTLCWPQLPLSCPYVDPMFAYVGLRNANPLSSDRKGGSDDGVTTGWGRGGVGVARPGRRLGRRASITFGYQPKASDKDTGAWPAPAMLIPIAVTGKALGRGGRRQGRQPLSGSAVLRRRPSHLWL